MKTKTDIKFMFNKLSICFLLIVVNSTELFLLYLDVIFKYKPENIRKFARDKQHLTDK